MVIGGYYINGYWCLLLVIGAYYWLLVVISGYYMNGYWCLLLVIGGYWWLLYEWLLMAII